MLYTETGSPLTLLSLASRRAAAESLAELLESQGIRVSSIYSGPLAQCSSGPSSESQSIDRYVKFYSTGHHLRIVSYP